MLYNNKTQISTTDHDIKDDSMIARAFRSYLIDLVRENAKYKNGMLSLPVYKLDYEDKLLVLSYLITPDVYADMINDPVRVREELKEHEDQMQMLIDDVANDVYHEAMQEMGMTLNHRSDNGEPFYSR